MHGMEAQMNKRRNRMILTVLALSIAALMCMVLAGCGGSQGSSSDGSSYTSNGSALETPSSETEANTDEDQSYDIRTSVGESLKNALPDDVDYDIKETSETVLDVYLKAAEEDGLGGHVASIMAFDSADELEDFPDYITIGEKDDHTIIAVFASDVQYDPSDDDQMADYTALTEAIQNWTLQ